MTGNLNIHIGRRLREARKARRWTQPDLGSAVSIRFQRINKYESAENKIPAAMLWKLAHALGVSVAYFFEGFEEDRTAPVEARSFAGAATHGAEARVAGLHALGRGDAQEIEDELELVERRLGEGEARGAGRGLGLQDRAGGIELREGLG